MTHISYIYGDATLPVHDGKKFIAHICNDDGAWGAGFVMALSARDRGPENDYRRWARGEFITPFKLGMIRIVNYPVQPETCVVNMIAQHGFGNGQPPIRYFALRACLIWLRHTVLASYGSVHMPRIGCGLAGGNWSIVQRLIKAELSEYDVPVTVYDLNQKSRSVFVHQYPKEFR